MNYLQERKISTKPDENPKLLKLALGVNFLLVVVFFALNFLGSPLLKYAYLANILFAIWATLFLNYLNLMPVLFTLYFIEGQGRILWGNAGWTKFIFDAIVLLSVFKIFIINKKIYSLKNIPPIFLALILLHFLAYTFSIFNIDTISPLAAIASAKLYIYPILYFFALTQAELDTDSLRFQKFLNFFIFLLFLEVALVFTQYYFRENFLLQISQNYQIAMKDAIFTGAVFRPFGTSFAPGTISVFFYLTIGFLFLKKKSTWSNILNFVLILLSAIAIMLCQVRSAMLKFALIYLLIQIGNTIFQRFKLNEIFKLILVLAVFIWGVISITNINSSLTTGENGQNSETLNQGIEHVKNRFMSLSEEKTLKNSRIGISDFIRIASEKLANKPFGYGSGFTGVLGRLGFKDSDDLNIKKSESWAADNLYVALIIEFGVFSIFYILVIFFIPIYFFKFVIKFFVYKMESEFRIMLICFSSLIVITLGNWGVVGITYNPESFAFWFFAALGFSTIGKYKRNNEQNLLSA